MKEYWRNDQATADNIDVNGWLDTGDIGRLDEEGYLYIMVRLPCHATRRAWGRCRIEVGSGLRRFLWVRAHWWWW
jgi:hypothetical protein